MLIKITTFNLDDMSEVSSLHRNLLSKGSDEWIFKHLHWAMANNLGVQLINNADSEDEGDKEKQRAWEAQQAAYHANNGIDPRGNDRDRPIRKVQKIG